ncbi:rCG52938 [Rattus norvegicus]|uniref:RCG52938 n=1 Tax=Rattus norvegicus TaxID=10116 RepID=A6IQU6_RAT|nr:rCG52938 [Rattus norvegicus]
MPQVLSVCPSGVPVAFFPRNPICNVEIFKMQFPGDPPRERFVVLKAWEGLL